MSLQLHRESTETVVQMHAVRSCSVERVEDSILGIIGGWSLYLATTKRPFQNPPEGPIVTG